MPDEPPSGEEHNPDNLSAAQVGEGWRLLRGNEVIEDGDQYFSRALEDWMSTGNAGGNWTPERTFEGLAYRRRIQPPAPEPATESVEVGSKSAVPVSETTCTNHYSDGSKIFPNRDCCQQPPEPTEPAKVGSAEQRIAELTEENAKLTAQLAEAKRDGRWSKELPNDQGYWWWWNEDEDSAPIVVNIFYSGTDGTYFAPAGQYGWTRFQPCSEMGGFWMRQPTPDAPHDLRAAIDAASTQPPNEQ